MGTRILCTDCHNSDDNREFGGTGPSGPHGSIFHHILERRYEFGQAALPGRLVTQPLSHPRFKRLRVERVGAPMPCAPSAIT